MQDPDFYMAWWIYLGTAAVMTVFVGWHVRRMRPCWFRAVFISFGVALLVTPTFGDETGAYWVPAVMAAMFDGLLHGLEATRQYVKPVATVWGGLCVLGFILCLITRKRPS